MPLAWKWENSAMKDPAARFSPPTADVLQGWVCRTLPLRPDGACLDPVATLIHRDAPTPSGPNSLKQENVETFAPHSQPMRATFITA